MANYQLANEEYYDQLRERDSDPPHAVGLAQRAAKAFRRAYEFRQDETVVMDFACGVGLLSRELIPYVKSIVGVDISQRVVDEYNRRVANQGLSIDEMHAVRVDVFNLEDRENRKMRESFDVVVCSASYHHFDDIISMTQALSTFLAPGGSLLVIDLLKDETLNINELFPEHGTHNIVAYRGGFTQIQIQESFTIAGLGNFEFDVVVKAKKKGYPVTLFIAQGVKPLTGEAPCDSVLPQAVSTDHRALAGSPSVSIPSSACTGCLLQYGVLRHLSVEAKAESRQHTGCSG